MGKVCLIGIIISLNDRKQNYRRFVVLFNGVDYKQKVRIVCNFLKFKQQYFDSFIRNVFLQKHNIYNHFFPKMLLIVFDNTVLTKVKLMLEWGGI